MRIVVVGIGGRDEEGGAGQRTGRGQGMCEDIAPAMPVVAGKGRRGRVKREKNEAEENEKGGRSQPSR
ncbi:MAG: hypothetical protein PHC88_15845 [Terrimicrobiaceae bacterium]|nr:hypothetical protein [Terrimicrobiaceae bacterium]